MVFQRSFLPFLTLRGLNGRACYASQGWSVSSAGCTFTIVFLPKTERSSKLKSCKISRSLIITPYFIGGGVGWHWRGVPLKFPWWTSSKLWFRWVSIIWFVWWILMDEFHFDPIFFLLGVWVALCHHHVAILHVFFFGKKEQPTEALPCQVPFGRRSANIIEAAPEVGCLYDTQCRWRIGWSGPRTDGN